MGGVVNLTLRPVTIADARLLHEWRSDQDTRRNSRNSDLIGWEEHEAWLARVLETPDRVIRIAEADGQPVGVIRADRMADRWELSWTVAPRARRQGIGGHMLRMFVASFDGRLAAVIHKGNLASTKIAAAAGLNLRSPAAEPDFELWTRE